MAIYFDNIKIADSYLGGIAGFDVGAIQAIYDNFSYTGRILREVKIMDGVPYVLFIFETSGTLTVTGEYTGDVWLCGGGAAGLDGISGTSGNTYCYGGGPGGGGGYTNTVTGVDIVSGEIMIGEGGTKNTGGGLTRYLTYVATGGLCGTVGTYSLGQNWTASGGNGGCGGGVSAPVPTAGLGQGVTTRPFKSLDMDPQCGGGASNTSYIYNYNPYGSNTTFFNGASASGGTDGSDGSIVDVSASQVYTGVGGFRGGSYRTSTTSSVFTNGLGYGGGGTGGYFRDSNKYLGTDGSPGAVMIRIAI